MKKGSRPRREPLTGSATLAKPEDVTAADRLAAGEKVNQARSIVGKKPVPPTKGKKPEDDLY